MMQIDTANGFSSLLRGVIYSAALNRDPDGKVHSAQLLVEHRYRGVGTGTARPPLPSGLHPSPPVVMHSTYYSCILVGEQLGPLVPYLDKPLAGLRVRLLGIATGGRPKDGKEIILLRSAILIPDTLSPESASEMVNLLEEEFLGSPRP